MKSDRLVIGKITSAHGIRGEMKVQPLTDDPSRFKKIKYFYFNDTRYDIESVRVLPDCVLIKTVQISDRTIADRLRGFIEVDRADANPLKKDEYYIEDLKGLTIKDLSGGTDAVITDLFTAGSTYVVEFTRDGKSFMIPFLKRYFVTIDVENSLIEAYLEDAVQ